jgi:hypothetical protein
MYLKKICNPETEKTSENGSLLGIIIFTLILLGAMIISSLTDAESKVFSLLDSLNTAEFIYFDFGSSVLETDSYAILDKLAEEMKSNPKLKLQITGHTDNLGSDEFNLELSNRRAVSVKEYLVLKGCNPDNILTLGKGKNEPAVENITDLGRAKNRRVEFTFLNIKKAPEEKDVTYFNSSFKQTGRNELTGDISIRDTSGEPIESITEDDVSAVLKWEIEQQKDSAEGYIRFIPIDDKKKIAFTFTMDYSPSMYNDKFDYNAPKTVKILAMEQAVHSFVSNMEQKHLARIIKFGSVIDMVQPYTRSRELLYNAITNKCYPRPGTAIYKSIYTALNDTIYNSNPTIMKTVIAFTDGEENASGKITKDSVFKLSERKGVKVYTVGLLDEFKHSFLLGMNSKDEADLVDIAARTGGFYWWAKSSSDLPAIYSSILNQILKSYQVSILWNDEKLPAKGTQVTAVVRVNVKGRIRTIYKDYVME